MSTLNQKQQGFTLLELVVVVALLGLVTSLATNYVVEEADYARKNTTDERRSVLRSAIESYYNNNNQKFPDELKDLFDPSKNGYPYILDAQFEQCTEGSDVITIPVFRDGWGNDYNADTAKSCSDPVFLNYGWIYTKSDSKVFNEPTLYSKGVSGNSKYPNSDYPLTTASSAASTIAVARKLVMEPVSGAQSTLICKDGNGDTVDIAMCIN
ncbi:MAG: prepilin-type N-terminal cleavage/methylation domain-containing protein [Amphritea sp.]|nr:prepilin-type N-terminal cleavage/methylation domain-containing protein [Amphritea sp.]